MRHTRLLGVLAGLFLLVLIGRSDESALAQQKRTTPRLEPVAETALLMDGLLQPNHRGLGKLLADRPTEVQAWVFARGQALLIAETGNLLMLRPPKGPGQEVWLMRGAELRETSVRLARVLAAQDYDRARRTLTEVTAACNRCHQTFRIRKQVDPFTE